MIERYNALRRYVISKLKLGWSPEQIVGRLARKKSKYSLCHETIYRFIYKNLSKKYYLYLTHQKKKRYRKRALSKRICRFSEKRLRCYLPRQTPIQKISQENLEAIAEQMNNTPRKCLGYQTPNELFLRQYKEICRTWV